MALSIDWETQIITVPKAYTTLIQSSPSEIRELPTNQFRLDLKGLEAEAEGMPHPRTNNHNTEVSLGGIVYARTLEIINGYTVTFEDGQYIVNLTGSNNNILDVTNLNQVSIRPSNAAGLISNSAIEYSSYNGGVTVDVNSGTTGTTYNVGTPQNPVDNMADAVLIDAVRGFGKIHLASDITLGAEATLDNFVVEGQSHVSTEVIVDTLASVTNVTFVNLHLEGILDGGNIIDNCVIDDLNYVNGHIHDSGLHGTITLGGASDANIVNCKQLDMTINPTIDMGGSGQNLVMPNFSGLINIINSTSINNKIGVGLDGGRVVLDTTTLTHGFIHVSGIGKLTDELGVEIPSGTWNTNVTVINELVSNEAGARAVWDTDATEHTTTDTFGKNVATKSHVTNMSQA